MWGTEIFVTFFKKYFSAFVSCLKYIIKCEMISGFLFNKLHVFRKHLFLGPPYGWLDLLIK